ncbi:MAG: hypothetical protein IT340_08190, partial [Chloroflexi bacterium]|nr:hypothetical protein [Chloroflexota bacterium]
MSDRRARQLGGVAALMIRLRYLILIVTTVVVTIVPTVMEGAQAIVYGVIGA